MSSVLKKIDFSICLFAEMLSGFTRISRLSLWEFPNLNGSMIMVPVFFGLNGSNEDGSRYAEDAIKKGASLAIIKKKKNFSPISNSSKIIEVKSPEKCLIEAAKIAMERYAGNIIGVTGSNRKTTTKNETDKPFPPLLRHPADVSLFTFHRSVFQSNENTKRTRSGGVFVVVGTTYYG